MWFRLDFLQVTMDTWVLMGRYWPCLPMPQASDSEENCAADWLALRNWYIIKKKWFLMHFLRLRGTRGRFLLSCSFLEFMLKNWIYLNMPNLSDFLMNGRYKNQEILEIVLADVLYNYSSFTLGLYIKKYINMSFNYN